MVDHSDEIAQAASSTNCTNCPLHCKGGNSNDYRSDYLRPGFQSALKWPGLNAPEAVQHSKGCIAFFANLFVSTVNRLPQYHPYSADSSRGPVSLQARIFGIFKAAIIFNSILWMADPIVWMAEPVIQEALSYCVITLVLLFWMRAAIGEVFIILFPLLELPTVNYPSITYLTCLSGSLSGDHFITVVGTGFHEDLKIMFGNKLATSTQFVSPNLLHVKVPPSTELGPVPVTIQGCELYWKATVPQFIYESPYIESMMPTGGHVGELIELRGVGFRKGQKILFGGIPVTETEFVSERRVQIRVPPIDKRRYVKVLAIDH